MTGVQTDARARGVDAPWCKPQAHAANASGSGKGERLNRALRLRFKKGTHVIPTQRSTAPSPSAGIVLNARINALTRACGMRAPRLTCRVPIAAPPPGQQSGYWSVKLDAIRLLGGSISPSTHQPVLCTPTTTHQPTTGGGDGGPTTSSGSSNGGPSCRGALDSGTSLITGTVRQAGLLNKAIGFSPGPSAPGGSCSSAVSEALNLIVSAGLADPSSTQLYQVCQQLGDGPLSMQAAVCGLVLSNIDGALPVGGGPPSQEVLQSAQNASIADCELLPYSFNATIECSKLGQLPDVSFVVDGADYVVFPSQYAAQVSVTSICELGWHAHECLGMDAFVVCEGVLCFLGCGGLVVLPA